MEEESADWHAGFKTGLSAAAGLLATYAESRRIELPEDKVFPELLEKLGEIISEEGHEDFWFNLAPRPLVSFSEILVEIVKKGYTNDRR